MSKTIPKFQMESEGDVTLPSILAIRSVALSIIHVFKTNRFS